MCMIYILYAIERMQITVNLYLLNLHLQFLLWQLFKLYLLIQLHTSVLPPHYLLRLKVRMINLNHNYAYFFLFHRLHQFPRKTHGLTLRCSLYNYSKSVFPQLPLAQRRSLIRFIAGCFCNYLLHQPLVANTKCTGLQNQNPYLNFPETSLYPPPKCIN